jgi:2-dehydropantoate 2-reductase
MKVCVFGAGAIGSFIASALYRAGQEVSVVARGAHLEAIRAKGLRVTSPAETTLLRPACSDTPADLGVQDAVLVTTKAHALPQVAQAIAPLLGPATTVSFIVNGIPWWYFHGVGGEQEGRRLERLDPQGLAWDRIGPQRAIGGVVNAPATVVAPGVVEVGRAAARCDLTLGEPSNEATARLQALVAAFGGGDLQVHASNDIRRHIWAKLVLNITTGPVAALTEARIKDIFASEAMADARRRMHAEAEAIAAAMGYPVRLDVEAMIAGARHSEHRASMGQDMMQRRPLELDAMCMAPLEMARSRGVATPTLDLLVELARVRAVQENLYPPRVY